MRLLLIAVRNLSRNFRRTLITALSVVFGVAAIVTLQGFVNGFISMAIENSVQAKVGALQVHKKGYIGADDPLKFNFPDDAELSAKLRKVPGVTSVAARINFDGMMSNGSESTMFVATAIDPANEYLVCPGRKTHTAAGSHALEPGKVSEALIGQTLADALGAKQGSSLVMQSAGPSAGGTNALDVEVSGFLPTVSIVESKRMATVSIPFAQNLLRMDGRITELALGVTKLEEVDAVAERVRSEVGADYEVTTWRQIDIRTSEGMANLKWVLGFVALVLFLLVATAIVNTMMMSVYERVREIGTMLAVGVRRWQVTVMFLEEALALGAMGAAAGVVLGYAIVAWLSRRGVVLRPPGGDLTIIRPHIEAGFLGYVAVAAIIGTVVAAVYPSWRASRLRPVDALRAT